MGRHTSTSSDSEACAGGWTRRAVGVGVALGERVRRLTAPVLVSASCFPVLFVLPLHSCISHHHAHTRRCTMYIRDPARRSSATWFELRAPESRCLRDPLSHASLPPST